MGRRIVIQLLGLSREGIGRRCPSNGHRLVDTRVPFKKHQLRESIKKAGNCQGIVRYYKKKRIKKNIKKEIKIIKVESGRQIACRRWVMETNPEREGEGAQHHERAPEAQVTRVEGEEQANYPAHELSMIEEVSSDAEQSGIRRSYTNRAGLNTGSSYNFNTYPSEKDDVFQDDGNAIIDALRAGNLQHHGRTYQQATPSGGAVQRRYTGGFRFHGDDDDFASSRPRRAETSRPMPSTFLFEMPAPSRKSDMATRRPALSNQTPTQSPRRRRVDINNNTEGSEHDEDSLTVRGSPQRGSIRDSQSAHSRDSNSSTLRMGAGIYPSPVHNFLSSNLINNDERGNRDSRAAFEIYDEEVAQPDQSSLHSVQTGVAATQETGERMITPPVDEEEYSFEGEIMNGQVILTGPGSWVTASDVSLPRPSNPLSSNIASHEGPFEWSPGKQSLLRRDGSLEFEQPVETPLLVPARTVKPKRDQGGPYGFGDNIYPEEWMQAAELGEGLYPPGNHHGLSDPFSASSAADRNNEIVEGVAGLKVTVLDHTYTPEALRRGQPNAQAAAQRNRLFSPFYNRLQELAGNPRLSEVTENTPSVGVMADRDPVGENSLNITLRSQQEDLLPEAIESPTAHILADYETSSEVTSIHQVQQQEASFKTSDHSVRNKDDTNQGYPTAMATYTFNTRDWGDYGSALVDDILGKPLPKIPGCTAGQGDKKNWKLTASSLQAYNAMRGSRMAAGDPLGTWISVKTQEALMNTSPEGKGKDKAVDFDAEKLQAFSADIAETFLEWPNIDKKDRQEVATVPRPQYQHLNPPEGFKYPAHLASSINGIASESYEKNFQDEYDISDDEGDPRDGRISPCTFRAFAEGCTRWDDPGTKLIEMPSDTARRRPKTPPGGSQTLAQPQPDRTAHKFTWQRDVEDGDQLSPAYTLPSNPSIVYSPPGIQPTAQMRNWTNNMYDRMDPLMAKRLRDLQEDADKTGSNNDTAPIQTSSTAPTASSENRGYTHSEVAKALTSPQARPVAGVAAEAAEVVIQERWQTAGRWRADEEALARRNDGVLTPRLSSVREELREVRASVNSILATREAKADEKLARRNRRILRQVSGHLREVKYQLRLRGQRLGETMVVTERLELEIASMEAEIQREVERAGLEDVAAVRAEVGEEFWGRREM
ncbi:hypothetical protein ACHAQA_003492 [Verticillium albo-atrum]